MTSSIPPVRDDPFGLPGVVEIIAHRGFGARAPENTRIALERGIEAGADAVEFDLHATADGVPVLLHDPKLDRTTDAHGPVHRRTLAELDGIDAGSWFGEEFRGEPVPTLASVLAGIHGRVGHVYAEVKRDPRPADVVTIVQTVVAAEMLAATVFISMDWDALDVVRSVAADASVGYIVDKRRRARAAIERASGDAGALLDFDARILLRHPALAERARDAGIALACWTVNSTEDADALLAMGVPRITTNRVAELVAWKETL